MNLNQFNMLVDALRDPGRYHHPVSRVEVVETHISAVLLAGELVYKIKKPVDFGFVDFSTLSRRKHFCDEELRLNRRFAPELYLGVVAIGGEVDAPVFDGEGPPLEYAVRMARFDQDALLDRCIRRPGVVTADLVDAFGRDVAAVHGRAHKAVPDPGYGTPATIQANVAECWEPARRIGPGDDPAVDELAAGMERLGERLEPYFTARRRQGHVRECHGDLHLGNLYLAQDGIRAFDCIEFNPSLRWTDVANDIAFCTMDLRFHDEPALARRLRNAYLEASGDYSLLHVLRFYEIYRALVRAKVASLREQDKAGTGGEDARAHLHLAGRLFRESRQTPLVVTHGLSGSGKTHVSGAMLEDSEAVRIRSDVERDRCIEAGSDRYTADNVDRVYRRLESVASTIIESGYGAIVDATFLKRAHRERFRDLAQRLGVPFHILHCSAPEAALRRRVARRSAAGRDASEADVDVLAMQLREMDPLAPDEQPNVVTYDTLSPLPWGEVIETLGLEEPKRM